MAARIRRPAISELNSITKAPGVRVRPCAIIAAPARGHAAAPESGIASVIKYTSRPRAY